MHKHVILDLEKQIDYRVGKNGMGSYFEGDVIKAYLIKADSTSDDVCFIYHPQEYGVHDVGECIDICKYHSLSHTYCPIEKPLKDVYINLPERKK